ncbi:hypothetical protein CPS_3040 [Colwellia psychrerythraea 34H]|uniref:Uncharacterized protein n=1 Tax=Colwellia psychrerythraea (strain 34H / ATCC BAA-681) TaxID=167879 RepID=Q47ZN1_COLP3|nr:hypothetical protein CPS_3040 [Colwellia psychrerythraea 34H]
MRRIVLTRLHTRFEKINIYIFISWLVKREHWLDIRLSEVYLINQ